MIAAPAALKIAWQPLPDDYPLPDDPVDNINQPALAAALTEALVQAGRLPEAALTPTNYAICATLDNRFVVKAPDWAYIPRISAPRSDIIRSYTPQLQGDRPLLVVEFLSDSDGTEYSVKPTYPPGKWFFYERVLGVPTYALFNPADNALEVYRLSEAGRYQLQAPSEEGRFWLPDLDLFLGVWLGRRDNREGGWLRWWDAAGNLLLWGTEAVQRERQRAEQERQRAERLAAQLRAAGLEPEGD